MPAPPFSRALWLEGLRVDIIALNVPQDAEFRRIKTTLQQGRDHGMWAYEEGSITRAWSSA